MRLSQIFVSMSGEQNAFGIGYPSIFVRFYGCGRDCRGCDTQYAMRGEKYEEVTPETVFNRIKKLITQYGVGLITLTGGEPLEQDTDELLDLMNRLNSEEVFISIETNGYENLDPFMDVPNMSFVVDWKLSSAKIKGESLIQEQVGYLGEDDFVKFVVCDDVDMIEAVTAIKTIREFDCKIAIGLHSITSFTYRQLIESLAESNVLGDVTINFQAHKHLKLD